MARGSYSRYGGHDQSRSPSRDAQLRRAAQMQARRDQEQSRRQSAREHIAKPLLNVEQRAANKFQGAHLLWLDGNVPAAQRWLDEILDKYPQTATAARASKTLERL
jgi:hypothetical protein